MHLIGYISDSIVSMEQVDSTLADITSRSIAYNKSTNITGVLFFEQGKFIQLIEGEESALRTLMQKIDVDDRHKNIYVFLDEPVDRRTCPDWGMSSINLDKHISLNNAVLDRIRDIYKESWVMETRDFIETIKDFLSMESTDPFLFR